MREAVYKLARDVTMSSKTIISLLQRSAGTRNTASASDSKLQRFEEILVQARSEFKKVHNALESIDASFVQRSDYWRFLSSWGFGVQEYVEAISFYHYLVEGALISKEQIEQLIQSDHSSNKRIEIPLDDYLLGLGDIAGELMRYATNSACLGDPTVATDVAQFLNDLYLNYGALRVHHREWDKKVSVMLESLVKVETVCYKLQIRGSEYPKELLGEMLESAIAEFDSEGPTEDLSGD